MEGTSSASALRATISNIPSAAIAPSWCAHSISDCVFRMSVGSPEFGASERIMLCERGTESEVPEEGGPSGQQ